MFDGFKSVLWMNQSIYQSFMEKIYIFVFIFIKIIFCFTLNDMHLESKGTYQVVLEGDHQQSHTMAKLIQSFFFLSTQNQICLVSHIQRVSFLLFFRSSEKLRNVKTWLLPIDIVLFLTVLELNSFFKLVLFSSNIM